MDLHGRNPKTGSEFPLRDCRLPISMNVSVNDCLSDFVRPVVVWQAVHTLLLPLKYCVQGYTSYNTSELHANQTLH